MSNRTFLFLLAMHAVAGQSESPTDFEPYIDRRQVFSVGVFGTYHQYKVDSDNLIRPGPFYVSPEMAIRAGVDTKGYPIGLWDLALTHEGVVTPALPPVVKDAAKLFRFPPPLNTTSLRLQSNWGMEFGMFPLNSLEIGVRYNQYSWRYDTPNNYSGTTVPYLKAMSWNRTAYARYTAYPGMWYVVSEVGGGLSSISYSSGIETYLHDGYQQLLIAEKNGITVPVSVMLGYNFSKKTLRKGDPDGVRVIPYVKYAHTILNVGTTEAQRRQISVGFRVVLR